MLGNPLLRGYLSFGQFAFFKSQCFSTRKRETLNYLIKVISFFNSFKISLVFGAALFGFFDLKLYLIELFLFDENYQKLIDFGIAVAHLGFFSGFSYWINLEKKPNSLESFRFLLISDAKNPYRFGKRYQLDKRSTERYLVVHRVASLFLTLLTSAYFGFFVLAIFRCLYHAFYHVSLVYFLSVSLFLTVLTLVGYQLMVLYIISKFILVLLSAEFLIIRVKSINALLLRRFKEAELISVGMLNKRRQSADIFKVLHILGDFCRQFKEVNAVLDSSISLIMLGAYAILFVIPYFLVFVEIPPIIRLLFTVLILFDYLFCFTFSFCNDRLRRQVSPFVNFEN